MKKYIPDYCQELAAMIRLFMKRLAALLVRIRKASMGELLFRAKRSISIMADRNLNNYALTASITLEGIVTPEYRSRIAAQDDYREYRKCFGRFYFDQSSREYLRIYLQNDHAATVESLQGIADGICRGRIPLFGKTYSYEAGIDWHKDPGGDYVWPAVHWSRIQLVDSISTPDPKFVWELNRHQFLIWMAMSYFLNDRADHAEFTLQTIEDWIGNNPYDQGINWSESLEVGMRLISWIWVVELLKGAQALTAERLERMVCAMHLHARHISRYLSFYISPNTHLTGEALALYLYSVIYPEDRFSTGWGAWAKQILNSEIYNQVGRDGVHKELSTAYHTYALEYYLQYILICRKLGEEVEQDVLDVVQSMCDFCLMVERPDGTVPNVGDSDGGSALPLDPMEKQPWKSVLCHGALLFNRPDLKHRTQYFPWCCAWLWGAGGIERYEKIESVSPAATSVYFKEANYAVYRSDWSECADYLLFDIGKMGFLSAGHSHADYLSFDLALSGRPYISDVGTYSYHEKKWRQYCRGTRAHNTIAIDNRDQATPKGSFSWDLLPDKGDGFLGECQEFTLIWGKHSAYPGLTHTRYFVVVRKQFLLCFDKILASGSHEYEFNYHFDPDITIAIEKEAIYSNGDGNNGILLTPFLFKSPRTTIHHGAGESGKGFCFPTYGAMHQINTVSISENNIGDFVRGMLFLPTTGEYPSDARQWEKIPAGHCYSLFTGNTRCYIRIDLKEYQIDAGKKIFIDCEFLVEKHNCDDDVSFFAVEVAAFRYEDRPPILITKKLSYLLVKLKNKRLHVYIDKNDQGGIAESIEDMFANEQPRHDD